MQIELPPSPGILLREEIVRPNERLTTIIGQGSSKLRDSYLLALDPGETTGVAIWVPGSSFILLQQWNTKNLGHSFVHLDSFVRSADYVFYEDYKVYEHKARDHVNNSLHTAQWIGCIRLSAFLHGKPVRCIMAQQAKTFWTDQKLEMCNVYAKGVKHARDALRHLLFHMTFTKD